jgi:hypothetical protein
MKRFALLLLTLAVALTTGCYDDAAPKRPSLSSPSPGERRDAVRDAQQKYGAHPPGGPTP